MVIDRSFRGNCLGFSYSYSYSFLKAENEYEYEYEYEAIAESLPVVEFHMRAVYPWLKSTAIYLTFQPV
jgi:hypothetical protein